MKEFAISMVLLMAFDLGSKLWRLYSGTWQSTPKQVLAEAVCCACLGGWGVWVLARNV